MPVCSICGEEHALLDPTFRRPEAYVGLDDEQREQYARSSDDQCEIRLPGEDPRFFLRCVRRGSCRGCRFRLRRVCG